MTLDTPYNLTLLHEDNLLNHLSQVQQDTDLFLLKGINIPLLVLLLDLCELLLFQSILEVGEVCGVEVLGIG